MRLCDATDMTFAGSESRMLKFEIRTGYPHLPNLGYKDLSPEPSNPHKLDVGQVLSARLKKERKKEKKKNIHLIHYSISVNWSIHKTTAVLKDFVS